MRKETQSIVQRSNGQYLLIVSKDEEEKKVGRRLWRNYIIIRLKKEKLNLYISILCIISQLYVLIVKYFVQIFKGIRGNNYNLFSILKATKRYLDTKSK